jgi:hypothetical protein
MMASGSRFAWEWGRLSRRQCYQSLLSTKKCHASQAAGNSDAGKLNRSLIRR